MACHTLSKSGFSKAIITAIRARISPKRFLLSFRLCLFSSFIFASISLLFSLFTHSYDIIYIIISLTKFIFHHKKNGSHLGSAVPRHEP